MIQRTFLDMADLLSDGFYLADGDLKIICANRTLLTLLGCRQVAELRELLDKRFLKPSKEEALSILKQEGRALNLKVSLPAPEGNAIPALEQIFVLKEPEAGAVYQGVIQLSLSGLEERYQQLVENMTEVICQVDDEGNIVFISPSVRPALGYNASEVMGRKIFEFLHEDDLFRASEDFDKYSRSGTEEDLVYRVRHANGRYLWMSVRARTLYNRDFLVTGVVLSARDITKIKEMEEAMESLKRVHREELEEKVKEMSGVIERLEKEIALRKEADRREAENQFRQEAILRVMPAVLYTAQLGTPMAAVWMSENVSYVTGYPVEKFLKESGFWIERVHPQDRETVEDYLSQVAAGKILATEYRWLCADGEYHWFLDQVVNVQISEKSITEYFGIWIDITAREEIRRKVGSARDG